MGGDKGKENVFYRFNTIISGFAAGKIHLINLLEFYFLFQIEEPRSKLRGIFHPYGKKTYL
jgi:hypothetical protein